ncbi:uncharacterized protein ARMOST_00156 [Armillaria ostoyae]|uniref:Uncharacterized protein n=1 Tax=Armillaria ostoyae TaxID=47428 RepID=A0A284QKC4_ARMOS|nr:uncharacterized protein ARMOST_00156 [Armillaria ostoyae]
MKLTRIGTTVARFLVWVLQEPSHGAEFSSFLVWFTVCTAWLLPLCPTTCLSLELPPPRSSSLALHLGDLCPVSLRCDRFHP